MKEPLPGAKTKDAPPPLEEIYRYYQRNIHAADQLIYEITKGAKSGESEEALLEKALEALDRMEGTGLKQEWCQRRSLSALSG